MKEEDRETGSIPAHEKFIDYSGKSDEELRRILEELLKEESRISYQRRILHGKIDMLRAELVRRKKEGLKESKALFDDEDIRRLSEILAGEALGMSRHDPTRD